MIHTATRPGFYVALLAGAVLVNAGGYLLSLWHDRTIFDEAVHLYTSFAVVAGIGRYTVGRAAFQGFSSRLWPLLIVGIALGVAWEVFEWAVGMIGSRRDTIMDLAMDTAGAAIASTLVRLVEKELRFQT